MAEKYLPTYRGILGQIVKGSLVHADETKGVVTGEGHYMWVFTKDDSCIRIFRITGGENPGRCAGRVQRCTRSDFYAAYDSVPCAQQKCLIHLMRDINEDMYKNPFDDELKEIARRFGALLREIVETIDTHGLKDAKFGQAQEIGHRIHRARRRHEMRNRGRACAQKENRKEQAQTVHIPHYDGIPWNNNNAEHAVRAFTRLRNVINTSTPKGTRNSPHC